jgi:uncharacterized OB-fold protein
MLAERPLPMPSEDTETYWQACHENRLLVPRCGACGHFFLPPVGVCPRCLAPDVALAPVSGRAKVFSFIVVHRPQHPAFFAEAPYGVAIVELEEGPRMHTRLVGIDPADVRIGMDVCVDFQKVDDEITLPVFKTKEQG